MTKILLLFVSLLLVFSSISLLFDWKNLSFLSNHIQLAPHVSTGFLSQNIIVFDHRQEILLLYVVGECSKQQHTESFLNLTLLLKTFSGHIFFLSTLLDSLILFYPQYNLLFISDDEADGKRLVEHVPRSKFIVDKLGGKAASYFGQMWSNLWSDLYSEDDYVAIMDSDMVFQIPLTV